MISFGLAVRAAGIFGVVAPLLFLGGLLLGWLKLRSIRRLRPSARGEMAGYRAGQYLSAVLLLWSITGWWGVAKAMRFDWSRQDVSEVEIVVYAGPDASVQPLRRTTVKDERRLSELLAALEQTDVYSSPGHEHAVGTTYALRLRRQSDGQWSRYGITIYPSMETADRSARVEGVYELSIEENQKRVMDGFQAKALGMLVQELAP